MPAFAQLTKEEIEAVNTYILSINAKKDKTYTGPTKKSNPYWEMPYNSTGYNKFLTKEGYPAVAPPWGTLTALNLQTGKIVWKNTLGDTPGFKATCSTYGDRTTCAPCGAKTPSSGSKRHF